MSFKNHIWLNISIKIAKIHSQRFFPSVELFAEDGDDKDQKFISVDLPPPLWLCWHISACKCLIFARTNRLKHLLLMLINFEEEVRTYWRYDLAILHLYSIKKNILYQIPKKNGASELGGKGIVKTSQTEHNISCLNYVWWWFELEKKTQ